LLLPDQETEAPGEWLRHRRLCCPLLVRLQRQYSGLGAALDQALRGAEGPSRTYGRWRAYLRTRDWHSHFEHGRACAVFALTMGRDPILFNLRDKPVEAWTAAEGAFMDEVAPEDVLWAGGVGQGQEEEHWGEPSGVFVGQSSAIGTKPWARVRHRPLGRS
jgi:hypothetical protein